MFFFYDKLYSRITSWMKSFIRFYPMQKFTRFTEYLVCFRLIKVTCADSARGNNLLSITNEAVLILHCPFVRLHARELLSFAPLFTYKTEFEIYRGTHLLSSYLFWFFFDISLLLYGCLLFARMGSDNSNMNRHIEVKHADQGDKSNYYLRALFLIYLLTDWQIYLKRSLRA